MNATNVRLWRELHLVRSWLLGSILLQGVLAGVVLAQSALISRIINAIFLQQAVITGVTSHLVLLGLVITLRALLNLGVSKSACEMAINIKSNLRQRLIDHLHKLGPVALQNLQPESRHQTANAMQSDGRLGPLTGFEDQFITSDDKPTVGVSANLALTAVDGIEALDVFYRDFIPSTTAALIMPLIMLIIVVAIDPLTAVVLLITAPLIPLFMWLIGSAAGHLAQRQFKLMHQLGSHFIDVVQGLETLKLFNRSRSQEQVIARITNRFRIATMRVLRVSFLSGLVLEMLSTLSIAVVAVEVGLRLLEGGIVFEPAMFLLIIAPEFYLPLRTLGTRFHAAASSTAAADTIYRLLDQSLPAKSVTVQSSSACSSIPTSMHIRFDRVKYTYPGTFRPALNEVTLEILAGQRVALVGASGSGKSTLANLLLGFITPDEGALSVDGADLASLAMEDWRKHVAWVPQRPYLYNTTLFENILLGRPDASREEVMRYAQIAGAHDFISQLPQRYMTRCGERGLRLSAGQATRIAIARALLKDAPLLIFDEGTANLDRYNEATVQYALEQMTPNRTALVIAHRLNTVMNADLIYVLDEGRVVETGTHSALIARSGVYQRLVAAFTGESVGT